MPAYQYQPPGQSLGDRLVWLLVVAWLLAMIAGLIYYVVVNLWVRLGFVVFILFTTALNYQSIRRLRQLAESRSNESICTFARAFNYRQIDTWIIRAVYEQLQPLASTSNAPFPLRPEDRLSEDFGIVDEDLDDLADEIAQRTGRRWENCEQNPYYGNVRTVGDLVMFFAHQPKGHSAFR